MSKESPPGGVEAADKAVNWTRVVLMERALEHHQHGRRRREVGTSGEFNYNTRRGQAGRLPKGKRECS